MKMEQKKIIRDALLQNKKEIIAPRRWGTENRQSGGFLYNEIYDQK